MEAKSMQIRVKKFNFENEFRKVQFKLLPRMNFNINKIGENIYSVLNEVKIGAEEGNDMPISVYILIEGIFEFDGESTEDIKDYINERGLEQVFAYTRTILATMTAVSGIPAINLPFFSFFKKNLKDNSANVA